MGSSLIGRRDDQMVADDKLLMRWIFFGPSKLYDLQSRFQGVDLFRCRACAQTSPSLYAVEKHPRDTIGMARGVDHAEYPTVRYTNYRKSIEFRRLDNRFEILHVSFSREINSFTIRQAATAPVELDHCVMFREQFEPRTPHRTGPVMIEMVDPMLPK